MRLHAEMNLNFIRVWGGGIAERPEFYDACDEYGILVMQDFWISGEYSDPSSEGYTQIFLNCAKDTIRMLRNHASLCFWTGANETDPRCGATSKALYLLADARGLSCWMGRGFISRVVTKYSPGRISS